MITKTIKIITLKVLFIFSILFLIFYKLSLKSSQKDEITQSKILGTVLVDKHNLFSDKVMEVVSSKAGIPKPKLEHIGKTLNELIRDIDGNKQGIWQKSDWAKLDPYVFSDHIVALWSEDHDYMEVLDGMVGITFSKKLINNDKTFTMKMKTLTVKNYNGKGQEVKKALKGFTEKQLRDAYANLKIEAEGEFGIGEAEFLASFESSGLILGYEENTDVSLETDNQSSKVKTITQTILDGEVPLTYRVEIYDLLLNVQYINDDEDKNSRFSTEDFPVKIGKLVDVVVQ